MLTKWLIDVYSWAFLSRRPRASWRHITQKAVAVIGYNNTRIEDVRLIRRLARQMLDAHTFLVKDSPTAADREAVDYVAEGNLNDHSGGCSACERAALDLGLEIIAVLPFSDRGVVVGAQWANSKGLPGCDPARSVAGLDKLAFRTLEAECSHLPSWYYRPVVRRVRSLDDILEHLNSSARFCRGIYVKPTREGNSRGGTYVTDRSSAEASVQAITPYLTEGALSEEYLLGREYSSDAVGGMEWVTEKETTPGLSRAEVQQIVPAPLPLEDYSRISEAGAIIAEICGAPPGNARHIEVMRLADAERELHVGAVEPNLRPAGMKIWDLAEVAFDRSPWREWLRWAAGSPHGHAPVRRRCSAGIRMITAPQDGTFLGVPEELVLRARAEFPAVLEIDITQAVGMPVRAEARDNSGFIGQVLAKHEDPEVLRSILRQVCDFVSQNTVAQG